MLTRITKEQPGPGYLCWAGVVPQPEGFVIPQSVSLQHLPAASAQPGPGVPWGCARVQQARTELAPRSQGAAVWRCWGSSTLGWL